MTYTELPSDAAFTQFLAQLTPGKVLRDREAMFSKSERKQIRWVRVEARQAARDAEIEFTDAQLRAGERWAAQRPERRTA